MSRLLLVALLAAIPGSNAFAGAAIPWFHTRPKPVVLEDPAPPAPQRVAYHGSAVYPKTGRFYFEDSRGKLKQEQSPKFRFSDLVPGTWLPGSQPQKANSARSK